VFQTALAEVRNFSDTRTPEQLRIAQYWGAVVNTSGPAGLGSVTALGLALQSQRSEAETARMLAMMHMAAMDAKYTYWYSRPYQADAAITTCRTSKFSLVSLGAFLRAGGKRDRVCNLTLP
jgi:hypothetical protein